MHRSSARPRTQLRLAAETLRTLATAELARVQGGQRDTPITPECPSEYPMCTPT